MAELDAERVDETVVRRLLPPVIGLDAVAREGQRIERAAVAGGGRGVDIGLRHAHAELVEIDAVEFLAELDQRAVAVLPHVVDDGAHRLLDVLRGLALGGEKSGKARREIRGSAVEAYRHARGPRRDNPGVTGQWPAPEARVNPV